MGNRSTIFALSSAPGRAAIAVVRVSGTRAGAVIDQMAPPRPIDRMSGVRRIRHPESGETLDQGLIIWLAGPKTDTSEDIAEFHVHGGTAIVRSMLSAIGSLPGCRLAEPGEFTRRAFENGKIDLAQAEARADLVDAETEAQRRQALRQMNGALSSLYDGWRSQLIEASSLVEAAIDFSDELDVANVTLDRAHELARNLRAAIAAHLEDGNRGEILREGFRVVLAGAPNVGKSSLLNALARRDAAIVSEEEGTTRDVIEVRLDLEGLPIIVSDTAGIRDVQGSVEREGVRRTLASARDAELVIWLSDATAPETNPPAEIANRGEGVLHVANKIDLLNASKTCCDGLAISAKTGAGIDGLSGRLTKLARERIGDLEAPPITQARYRENLSTCLSSLDTFLSSSVGDIELRAEDLRCATHALGRITGRVDVEDLLGQVFSRFCIGK
jgi:tRNA modification GTPase